MRSGLSTSASSDRHRRARHRLRPRAAQPAHRQGPSATASRHAPMSIFRAPPGAALAFRASAFRQGSIRHPRVVSLGRSFQADLYLTRVPVSRIRSASTTPMRLVGSAIRSAACAEIVRPPGVTLVPSHCRAANSASNLTSADEGAATPPPTFKPLAALTAGPTPLGQAPHQRRPAERLRLREPGLHLAPRRADR
jgi:hypothetical protein